MKTILRPYQQKANELIRNHRASGGKGAILQMPTGAGKTATFCDLLMECYQAGEPAIMAVRGKDLVHQASRRLRREGIRHGIYQGANSSMTNENILLCSIDTLYSRKVAPKAKTLIFDECFSPDMEIMTERGFVRFDELDKETLVAQFDEKNKSISYTKPTGYIEKDVTDQRMIEFTSDKKISLSVTEDHDMLIECSSGYKKIKARKLGTEHKIPSCGLATGSDDILTPIEKLLIAFQADGHDQSIGKMHFTFSRQRKIESFLELMKEGGFLFKEIKASAGKRRFSVDCSYIKTKNLWDVFYPADFSLKKCRDIIEFMVKWDGHIYPNGSYYFSSTEKRNSEFYQIVAVMAGYHTNLTIQHDDRKKTFKDIYRLFITKNKSRITTQNITRKPYIYTGKVYCVSVPTGNILVRRDGKVIVCGNCHLTHSDAYYWFISQYPEAFKVGVSATPHHSKGMTHIGDILIRPITIQELIDDGYLVGGRYFAPYVPNLKGIKKTNGDFNSSDLSKRSKDDEELTGNAAKIWDLHLRGKSTICYGVSLEHCQVLKASFDALGAKSVIVSAKTSDTDRQTVIRMLEDGDLDILISVGVLTTGVDIPSLKAIVCCRPTESYNLWIQMLGRGTRPHPDKKCFLLYDLSGNIFKHGSIEVELEADLYGKSLDKPKISVKTCVNCYAVVSAEFTICPHCGNSISEVRERTTGERIHGLTDNTEVFEIKKEEWELELPGMIAEAKEKQWKKGSLYHKIRAKYGEEAADKAWLRIKVIKKWPKKEKPEDGIPSSLTQFWKDAAESLT